MEAWVLIFWVASGVISTASFHTKAACEAAGESVRMARVYASSSATPGNFICVKK